METIEEEFKQITADIVNQAITCARQTDKWRKPYAAIVDAEGNREFIRSVGQRRTALEAEDIREREALLTTVSSLPVGYRVETRDRRDCSHKTEYRDSWTRTADGWKHERIEGSNRHGC
jgi:hypothetical protein